MTKGQILQNPFKGLSKVIAEHIDNIALFLKLSTLYSSVFMVFWPFGQGLVDYIHM